LEKKLKKLAYFRILNYYKYIKKLKDGEKNEK